MNQKFFINNRKKFGEKMEDYSVSVIFSGKAPRRSLDAMHKFSVDRNFFYMTGIDRENMALVMTKYNGEVSEILFIPPVDEMFEKWNGILLKEAEAIEISGVKTINSIEIFENHMGRLFSSTDGIENLYIVSSQATIGEIEDDYKVFARKVSNQFPTVNIISSLQILIELRTQKQPEEIEEMKKAVELTKIGLESLMKNLKPGMFEYQVRAYYEHELSLRNSAPSFETIAASGKNAVILHYTELVNKLNDGDLILCDLGALSNNYASDITRTYPVNGKFTQRQKDLYNIVLGAQDVAFDIMRPGVAEADVNKAIIDYYSKELKAIKLIKDESEVSKYYYHGLGHPLGLDVHDLRSRNRCIANGNVYTVEPGLYIAEEGIGIRIEDDVIVTESGIINLSKDIIKTVEDIENFMK